MIKEAILVVIVRQGTDFNPYLVGIVIIYKRGVKALLMPRWA